MSPRVLAIACAICAAWIAVSCSAEPVGKIIKTQRSECLDCATTSDLKRCADGLDNDEDRLFDCDDPDCRDLPACNIVYSDLENTAALCGDGFDNDQNGHTDCADYECVPTEACQDPVQKPENTAAVCSDGLDNDHDGNIDCRDPDCQIPAVQSCEGSDASCTDGIDNDNNGYTDCSDFACSKNPNVTVCR